MIIVHSVVHKCWLINGDKIIEHGTYDIMINLVLLALGFMKLEMHRPQKTLYPCEVINYSEGISFHETFWLSAKIRQFENLASSHKSLMEILKRTGTQDNTS
jgi:hypothetical protein